MMSVTRAAAHRATHGALTGVRGRCVRGNARRWYVSCADNRQQQQAWTTGCRCAGGACACSTTSMRAMRREGVRIPRRGTRTEAKKGFLFGELEDVKRDAEGGDESSSAKSVRWSEPLAIAKYPAPCLRAKNAPVECFDANLEALSKAMFKIMYETIGCGLAAPQVGVNYRMMVYNEAGEPGKGREVVLCNPKIVKYSKETDLFEEGCLSFPKMYADVERPIGVQIEAQNLKGKKFKMTLDGFEARVFQHEYDHLDGVLYHDRMSEDVRAEVQSTLDGFVAAYPGEDKAL